MVPGKTGMGSSAAVSIAAIRAVLTIIKRAGWRDLRNPGQSSETIAHIWTQADSMPRPVWAIKPLNSSECRLYPLELGIKASLVIADYGNSQQYPWGDSKGWIQREGSFVPFPWNWSVDPAGGRGSENEWSNRPRTGSWLLAMSTWEPSVSAVKSRPSGAVALENGALGAKMRRGGLGGCVIALVKDSREAATIAHALEKRRAHHTWIENL